MLVSAKNIVYELHNINLMLAYAHLPQDVSMDMSLATKKNVVRNRNKSSKLCACVR